MIETQEKLEIAEGYSDAKLDIETMLSCPVCHAIKYLEATKGPASPYLKGWRLAMIDAKYSLSHEAPCSTTRR